MAMPHSAASKQRRQPLSASGHDRHERQGISGAYRKIKLMPAQNSAGRWKRCIFRSLKYFMEFPTDN
jgi:hypothetical protein